MLFYANLGLKSSGYIIFVIRNEQISLKTLENFVVIINYANSEVLYTNIELDRNE